MVTDDYLYGYDPRLETRIRLRMAKFPRLAVAEMPPLRCQRRTIEDTAPDSPLRFSAIYCPVAYGPGLYPGMVRVVQEEQLQLFVVLTKYKATYVNVTQTMNAERLRDLRTYALGIYREAFARGQLR